MAKKQTAEVTLSFDEQIALRRWCVEQAGTFGGTSGLSDVQLIARAEAIRKFVVKAA